MSSKTHQCPICKTILLCKVGLLKHLETHNIAAESFTTDEEEMVQEDSTETSDSGSTSSDVKVIEPNTESSESGSVDVTPPPPEEVIDVTSSSSNDAMDATAAELPVHFFCNLCNQVIASGTSLEEHLENEHNDGTSSPEMEVRASGSNIATASMEVRASGSNIATASMEVRASGSNTATAEMRVRTSSSNKATAVATNKPLMNYFCHICDQVFSPQSLLNEHLNKIHELKPLVCVCCDEQFFREDLLHDHEIQYHGNETLYRCEVCQKRFVTEVGLQTHRCVLER